MRLNIEDQDFSSSKLKMAAALFEVRIVKPRAEHSVLGLLSNLWYCAINESKQEFTIKDLRRYTGIYHPQDLENIIFILTESEYIEQLSDGNFRLIGKEKDFVAKEKIDQQMEERRLQKKILAEQRKERNESPNVVKCAKKALSTEQPTDLRTVLPADLPTVLQYNTVHNNTVQNSTNSLKKPNIFIPSSEEIPSTASKGKNEKGSQILKEKYFELYEKKFGEKPIVWGMVENVQAKKILSSISLENCLNYLERFFSWNHKYVIDAGYPFSRGGNSFISKLGELQADILRPERRIASASAGAKLRIVEEEQKRKIENEKTKIKEMQKYRETQARLSFSRDEGRDNDLGALMSGMLMHYKLRSGIDHLREAFEKLYPGEEFNHESLRGRFPLSEVERWMSSGSPALQSA